ncbi:hypothetical protein BST95_13650 [Halioglobus japonicus]|uniref:TlpA family protein disulfide reductase n=1 Tax=Halioglobus japonicus TaxID=930805 RepID=A0AAP8SQ31_9GAMM|nr:TlpA disulfide reductase family protein [Halioglobus japonicus]AQA19130.1 hypothetical protein BST95_13650 [Halioglobus japonicus]PLW87843.1 TlpA family protein disulfide reductase [Halioglobus japonicus]GHD06273.1 thiol:disulfide interchange protein [Halioglobus japonicus]
MRAPILSHIFVALLLLSPGALLAVDVGQRPPSLQLPSLTDTQQIVSLDDFSGKVVYLDFWASWCGPCRVSLPALNRIYAELQSQGLVVVAVNVDAETEDAQAFLARYPVDYEVLLDPEGNSPADFEILGMPTAFYIDRNGVVRGVHTGFRKNDEQKVRATLMELLNE